jgi:hypothetical protein
MHFFARLRIDLQISIFGFFHELLVFSIFHRENVKSESHTPLRNQNFENFDSQKCFSNYRTIFNPWRLQTKNFAFLMIIGQEHSMKPDSLENIRLFIYSLNQQYFSEISAI